MQMNYASAPKTPARALALPRRQWVPIMRNCFKVSPYNARSKVSCGNTHGSAFGKMSRPRLEMWRAFHADPARCKWKLQPIDSHVPGGVAYDVHVGLELLKTLSFLSVSCLYYQLSNDATNFRKYKFVLHPLESSTSSLFSSPYHPQKLSVERSAWAVQVLRITL